MRISKKIDCALRLPFTLAEHYGQEPVLLHELAYGPVHIGRVAKELPVSKQEVVAGFIGGEGI